MTLLGVDLSHFQGAPNFASVRRAGNSFVILKASESTNYTDATFAANRANARAAGLVVGAYHFARAGDPIAEADHFCAVVGSLAVGELVVLDWEVSAPNAPAWCRTWLDRVASRLGVRPLIYMNQSARDGSDWSPVVAGNYGLWIAQYDNLLTVPSPGRWPAVAMKQFTSSGSVPGVLGSVDRNVFFGDTTALAKYGKQPPPPPPPKPIPSPGPTPEDFDMPYSQWPQSEKDALKADIQAAVWADSYFTDTTSASKPKILEGVAVRDIWQGIRAIKAKLGI